MHAAVADASRRRGSLEARRCCIQPVTDAKRDGIAGQLAPGGITDTESAFCTGTMTSEPTHCRPVAAMRTVLAAARGLGARARTATWTPHGGPQIITAPTTRRSAHAGDGLRAGH